MISIEPVFDEFGNPWFGIWVGERKDGNDFASLDAAMDHMRSLVMEAIS